MSNKTEYEKCKWYWTGNSIARFSHIRPNSAELFWHYSELYTREGNKEIKSHVLTRHVKQLATPDQIESCLKAYAEKNGYVGSKIKLICGAVGNVSEEIKYLELAYEDLHGRNGCNSYTIYHQGKWAEIVKEEKQVPFMLGQSEDQDFRVADRFSDFKELIGEKDILITPKDTEINYLNVKDIVTIDIRGQKVPLSELIDVYQKYLDNKTIIG